ncbi:MAG TPA: SurA N-terminal domain-containing protein [Candidatus Atribacteria bacterium]|nr:SurA N-terminal domain-containing protein [Candidatus Atribacteria bacterium]
MLRNLRKHLDVILIIVVIAFAVTMYYGYGSYQRSGRSNQAVAATVNGTAITFYEVDQAFRNLISQYDSKTLNQMDENSITFLRRLILENLINNELLYQEAKSRRIQVSSSEVEEQIEFIRAQFPSEEDFRRYLEYQGITLASLREAIKRELMINKLEESLAEGITIPEEEIQKYYEENKSLFITPPQYHLRQMTFSSKEEAETVLKRLYLGEDFAQLAKDHSQDSYASQGGDLGWVSETSLPPEVQEALTPLRDKPLAITPVIEVGEYYYIYQIMEFKPQEERKYEEAKEDIERYLKEEQKRVKINHLVAELREKSKITIADALQIAEEIPSPESSVDTQSSPEATTEENEEETPIP